MFMLLARKWKWYKVPWQWPGAKAADTNSVTIVCHTQISSHQGIATPTKSVANSSTCWTSLVWIVSALCIGREVMTHAHRWPLPSITSQPGLTMGSRMTRHALPPSFPSSARSILPPVLLCWCIAVPGSAGRERSLSWTLCCKGWRRKAPLTFKVTSTRFEPIGWRWSRLQ